MDDSFLTDDWLWIWNRGSDLINVGFDVCLAGMMTIYYEEAMADIDAALIRNSHVPTNRAVLFAYCIWYFCPFANDGWIFHHARELFVLFGAATASTILICVGNVAPPEPA